MVIDYLGTKNPDFIGDINGHFDTLIKLFDKLGYKKSNGMYSHPDITVLICGKEGLTAMIPRRWLQNKIPKFRTLSFFGLR